MPPIKPDIGPAMLRIDFPNKYVQTPTEHFHKLADDGVKTRVRQPWFSDALTILIADTYKRFQAAGHPFIPPPMSS